MKILASPDSFKGSLSSFEVCSAIKRALNTQFDVEAIPFADGGEGFCDAYLNNFGGEKIFCTCTDTLGDKINCSYIKNGSEAIIESAAASGLRSRKDALGASSRGTGELILHAIRSGAKSITVALGGSGCTDGGTGSLSALGVEFLNASGKAVLFPNGKTTHEIKSVSHFPNYGVSLTLACDVENPFCGENGAALIYSMQKGATAQEALFLDEGLKNIQSVYERGLCKSIASLKGAGAAGGLCGGLYALFGGRILSGFDYLCEKANLEEKIKSADLIITGEGKTDSQTLMGKLPYKICVLAKKYGKKTCLISGQIDGVSLADIQISLTDENTPVEEAVKNASKLIENKLKEMLL